MVSLTRMKQQDQLHILQCLELAIKGKRLAAPNPMVGSIIVHDGKIIGEGYHVAVGTAHGERAAIQNVKDKSLLSKSTLYINLEPCGHHGRTPPCSDFIIEHNIPRVVYGCKDNSEKVSGKGVQKLKEAGVEVVGGVLEKECCNFNRRFLTFNSLARPYIILKWAETSDGFIAKEDFDSKWISCEDSRALVHEWRSEESSIMVGTNTAIHDNPILTVRIATLDRKEFRDPLRIVLDRDMKIPITHHLLDQTVKTLVFTSQNADTKDNLEFVQIDFSNNELKQVLSELYKRSILSIMVEGGSTLINSFIKADLWDEARVFKCKKTFSAGIAAPLMNATAQKEYKVGEDTLQTFTNHKF